MGQQSDYNVEYVRKVTERLQNWRVIQERKMAERTGLEPATPGVTGRYSNQLNYRSAQRCRIIWGVR